jgi:hypothetical protein
MSQAPDDTKVFDRLFWIWRSELSEGEKQTVCSGLKKARDRVREEILNYIDRRGSLLANMSEVLDLVRTLDFIDRNSPLLECAGPYVPLSELRRMPRQ